MKRTRFVHWAAGNPKLVLGGVMLAALLLTAAFGPMFCANPPDYLYDEMLLAPCAAHPFGTDGVGCDVLTMVIYGARTSLKIGMLVAVLSSVIGVAVGGVSGYLGGAVDRVISEILNVLMMVPSFFLMVLAIAVYGSSINNMILVMALTSWAGSARLMRGQAMAIREKAFIKNMEVLGQSRWKIIFFHIVPNCLFTIVVDMSMAVSAAILSEAGLSFLGLGDPNVVSWGKVISLGRRYLPSCWWIGLFPGVAIILTSLAFHLLGDGVNHMVDRRGRDMV